MFKSLKKLFKNEEGQALVLVALFLVVLLSFTAIVVDYGYLAWQRRNLQNAADSAALAAAWELPNESQVQSVAENYAQKYAPKDTLLIDARRDPGNSNAVIVDVAHTYNTFFARVLGSNSQMISATATAEKILTWEGESLPFLNLGFDYLNEEPEAWTNMGPGIKGTVGNFYVRNSGTSNVYYEVDYRNGIEFVSGYSNPSALNGPQNLKLKTDIGTLITNEKKGEIFYLFSLRSKYIQEGEVTVNGGESPKPIDDLKNNGDIIDPNQLVLLQVKLLDFKESNHTDIELEFTGKVFDLGNDVPGDPLPDFPTENLITNSNSSRLIN